VETSLTPIPATRDASLFRQTSRPVSSFRRYRQPLRTGRFAPLRFRRLRSPDREWALAPAIPDRPFLYGKFCEILPSVDSLPLVPTGALPTGGEEAGMDWVSQREKVVLLKRKSDGLSGLSPVATRSSAAWSGVTVPARSVPILTILTPLSGRFSLSNSQRRQQRRSIAVFLPCTRRRPPPPPE
jgi:hypothetical protein